MAIDLSAITDQFSASEIILNLLIVLGAVAALWAWAKATGYTLALLRGDLASVDRRLTDMASDAYYRKRLHREQRAKGYRAWKRRRGL